MRKLTTDAYLNHDNDEVIVFGKGSDQTQKDSTLGIARFGGQWRQPSYQRAYLRAARVLLAESKRTNDLDQLGLPIFYLLRHSTELLIKGMLGMLYEIAEMREGGQSAAANLTRIPSKNARERLHSSHDLAVLCRDLTKASTSLGFIAHLPDCLPRLVQEIGKHEMNPTWSRYSNSGRDGKTNHSGVEVALPVVDLLGQLEAVVKNVAADPSHDSTTLGGEIYFQWNCLMQQQ